MYLMQRIIAPIDREEEEISEEELELVESLLWDLKEIREEQNEEVLSMNFFDDTDDWESLRVELSSEHWDTFVDFFNTMVLINSRMDMHQQSLHEALTNWWLNVKIEDFVDLMWDESEQKEVAHDFFGYQTTLVMDKFRQEYIWPKYFAKESQEHQEAIMSILPMMILEEMYGIHPDEPSEIISE